MLTKPELEDAEITKCLQEVYGLNVNKICFLPLGADLNTAVYSVSTSSNVDYFLKLRRGEFNEASVSVPKYLADSGLKQIIAPLTTVTGELWAPLASFKTILYPYVEGHNAIERKLSDEQWIEFGRALKKFHSTDFPKNLTTKVPKEAYQPKWRETVRSFLERIKNENFSEPTARELAIFLKSKATEVLKLIEDAESLSCSLQKQPLEYILCHADIHGWNLLIDKKDALYMVDWDTLIFAPKERDLMFIGAGLGDTGRIPSEEEELFYQGYGQTDINHAAIAYYRSERIIEDIGVTCELIFLSDEGGEDRKHYFEYLQYNFLPNGTIDRAYEAAA